MATPSANHFDAAAMAAAQEAPTLQVGRLLYRGRLLSLPEWLPFWDRQQALNAKPVAEGHDAAVARLRERLAFYRDYARAMFPRKDYRFWAPDPVKHLFAQPYHVVEQTMEFFFTLQALATFGKEVLEKAATTGGTSSKRSTTPPPCAASE